MSEYKTEGGHALHRTGRTVKDTRGKSGEWEWECAKCDLSGNWSLFGTGPVGCPADPASFPLWVCPGGDKCEGHMDTDSSQFRSWQEIPGFDAEDVPRMHCEVGDLARRAATQYRQTADRIGLRTSVWAQEGFRVGSEGGVVAELTHDGRSWSVRVDGNGKVTAQADTGTGS